MISAVPRAEKRFMRAMRIGISAVWRSGCASITYIERIGVRAFEAMAKAQIGFPQPNYAALKVAEECGELVRAAVHYSEGRATWAEVEAEAVQAIAMILRLLCEGDQVNGIIPPHLLGVDR
jgi:hypothetical protein